MPPLTDPDILAQFRAALSEWKYTGYVTAKDVATEWIADNLGGLTLKDVAKAMYDLLQRSEEIDQVEETRPEWNSWPFHYDFRLTISAKPIYIETILKDDDPSDPTVLIVSIHDA